MENQLKKEYGITLKEIATADPLARNIMQKTKEALGFVPNMYGVMANNPALIDAYVYSYNSFRMNSGFTPIEQEVIFLSVAAENSCTYCVAAHSFVADKMSGVPREVTNAIREGKEISDSKLNALSKFSRLITAKRGNVNAQEIEDFIKAGYTPESILGVITGVGVKTFSNYANHFAKTELDEMFSSRKWNSN